MVMYMGKILNSEKIMNVFNYIYWFFIGNLLMVLFNLPFCITLILYVRSGFKTYPTIFLLTLLTLGPSLTAIFYTMGRLHRDKDISIFKDFMKAYKENFLQSICANTLFLLVFIGFTLNVRLASNFQFLSIMTPFFYVGIFLIFIAYPYAFIILSRFQMKTMDLIKASFTLSIVKFKYTLINIIIFLFMLIIIEVMPAYGALFLGSVIPYLIILSNKSLLELLAKDSSINK